MIERSEDSSETTGGSLSSSVEEQEEDGAGGLTLTATASETVRGTGPGDGGEVDCDQNPMEREVKLQEDSELMSRDTSYFVITLETLLCTVVVHTGYDGDILFGLWSG